MPETLASLEAERRSLLRQLGELKSGWIPTSTIWAHRCRNEVSAKGGAYGECRVMPGNWSRTQ